MDWNSGFFGAMAFGKCGEFKVCTIFAKFTFAQLYINDMYEKARDRAAGRSQKEILAAWVGFRLVVPLAGRHDKNPWEVPLLRKVWRFPWQGEGNCVWFPQLNEFKCNDRENVAASISESRRVLWDGMRTDDLLALEQSAENLRVVGGTGFLAVIREVHSPEGLMWREDIYINKSGTAEGSFRLLGETGAFSFTRSCHIHL